MGDKTNATKIEITFTLRKMEEKNPSYKCNNLGDRSILMVKPAGSQISCSLVRYVTSIILYQ